MSAAELSPASPRDLILRGGRVIDPSQDIDRVTDVRQGKYFELDVAAATPDEARALAAEVAHKLLANPVIESYRIEVAG